MTHKKAELADRVPGSFKEFFHAAEDELVGDVDHLVHRDFLSVLNPFAVGVQRGVVDKTHQDFLFIVVELLISLMMKHYPGQAVCMF